MSDKYATVLEVSTVNVGEYLTADAASGATVLPVSDARTFDENIGGTIALNGEPYVYTAVDVDADTLTLFSGLLAAALENDRVEISPPKPIKRALVSLGDDGEGVWANVPQALTPLVPDGLRISGDAGETVLVEERAAGELYVRDVVASSPAPDVLTVPDLQTGRACVIKKLDQSRASTITPADDDELKVYLPVGLWRVELYAGALTTGVNTVDVRVMWTFTGSTDGASGRMPLGPQTASTDNSAAALRSTAFHALSSQIVYGLDGSVGGAIREDLLLDVIVEGTLTMQWAQGTSSAQAVLMLDRSRIYATRMSG